MFDVIVPDQEGLVCSSNCEKDFMMQGTGFALSVSHTTNSEYGDPYLRVFKRFDWVSAGSYCPQTSPGPISDLFMLEQVNLAFAALQKKLAEEALEPNQVNCMVIEANLGQSGSCPTAQWLANNLLEIHKNYPEAKLILYSGTEDFVTGCFDDAIALLKKLLVAYYAKADKNLDPILSNIEYYFKDRLLRELTNEAKKRPKAGMVTPQSSLGTPKAGTPAPSPTAAEAASGSLPLEHQAIGGAGFISSGKMEVRILAHPIPSTPIHRSKPKEGSPLREARRSLGDLTITTPERLAAASTDTKVHAKQSVLTFSAGLSPAKLQQEPTVGPSATP